MVFWRLEARAYFEIEKRRNGSEHGGWKWLNSTGVNS